MKYIHLCLMLGLLSTQTTFAATEEEIARNKDKNSLSSMVYRGINFYIGTVLVSHGNCNFFNSQIAQGCALIASGLTVANSDRLKTINPSNYIGKIPTILLATLLVDIINPNLIRTHKMNTARNLSLCVVGSVALGLADAALTKEKVTPAAAIAEIK